MGVSCSGVCWVMIFMCGGLWVVAFIFYVVYGVYCGRVKKRKKKRVQKKQVSCLS